MTLIDTIVLILLLLCGYIAFNLLFGTILIGKLPAHIDARLIKDREALFLTIGFPVVIYNIIENMYKDVFK